MNSVERVKAICKERKIPISRLERDLGYANGYIGQLRKGVFPDDRLVEISEYLSLSIDYILGANAKETPAPAEEGRRKMTDGDIKYALFGNAEIDDDVLAEVRRFAKFAMEQKEQKKEID